MAVHGRYTIVGKLADGGMAEIFLAMQHGAEGFQKPVVLKRILTAYSADPPFRNMFLDEAHISMSLNHSSIVQVLDLGVSNGRYFLVLELVDGWDLDRILRRARSTRMAWPPALSLYVVAEVCRALAFAHAKVAGGKPLGIVHRDISPNNVLVSEQGEIKLADFGIAKAQRKREQTAAGIIKGKIAFMSPEQALGGVLDRRSDLFSVGSMLYLMTTDRLPFEAATDLEAMLKVQKAEFTPPDAIRPGSVGPELSRIIMRAMRLPVSERYQTADEMQSDIERVLRTEYQSSGQTELKLWLGQLQKRDGAQPIGKTRARSGAASLEGAGTELNVGTSFELGDLDDASGLTSGSFAPGAVIPVGRQGPPPLPPPTPPADGRRTPEAARATLQVVVDETDPRRKSRGLRGFWLGAAFALGAVIGGRYLVEWARTQPFFGANPVVPEPAPTIGPAPSVPEKPSLAAGAPPAATPGPAPAPAPPIAAAPAAPTAPVVAAPPAAASPLPPEVAAKPDAGVAPAVVMAQGKGGSPAAPAGAPAAADSDQEPDEEALLRDAVPNAENAVIGEEEAESEPAGAPAGHSSPGAHTKGQAKGSASSPGPASSAAAPHAESETVSVRITSSPVGAVVRTKHKVLGRTPISLHFRSGNTYELAFLKQGYAQTTKRITIATGARAGKDRKLSVVLKKNRAAVRRQSFFHPHR